jgi:hypothetical protein
VRRVCLAVALLAVACDPGSEPDFELVAPADPILLVRGQLVEVEVGLERLGGFDRTVVVTAGGLRAGITPGTALLGPGEDTAILTIAVETSAVLGPIEDGYLVGLAGELERTVAVTATVTDP